MDNVSYGEGKWTMSAMEGKVDNVSYGGGKWTMSAVEGRSGCLGCATDFQAYFRLFDYS